MALQFDPGSYFNAYQMGEQNRMANQQRPLNAINSIAQTLGNIAQQRKAYQDAQRQEALKQQMLDLERQKMAQDQERWQQDTYGAQPGMGISYGQMPQGLGTMFTQPQGQVYSSDAPTLKNGKMPFVEGFQSGFWKADNKLRPNYMAMQSTQPGIDVSDPNTWANRPDLTLAQKTMYSGLFGKLKDTDKENQKSLDNILAEKVAAGDISIEDAYKLKAQSSGGSFMIGGMTQGGQPVFYNTKDPSIVRTGNVPGGGILYPKTPPDSAMNASLFGQRANEANSQLETIVGNGFDPTSIVTGSTKLLPNIMQSPKMQQFEQAKRNFVNAVLRKESGALISNEEMASADLQYFPQVGDSEEVLNQKKINRITAIEGLNRMAGPMRDARGVPSSNRNTRSSRPSAEERYNQLISEGLSENDVYKKLAEENY